MIPAVVRRKDQQKYTVQLNTRHKLHLCREALVTAFTALPLENTSQMEALSNPATALQQLARASTS